VQDLKYVLNCLPSNMYSLKLFYFLSFSPETAFKVNFCEGYGSCDPINVLYGIYKPDHMIWSLSCLCFYHYFVELNSPVHVFSAGPWPLSD
jgi:hypothetical protein